MKTRVRYALLFVLAAAPLVGVGSIKPAPLILGASIFALHGMVSLVTRGKERSTARDLLSATLLLGCFEVSGIFLITSLAMVVALPVMSDGHHVMPMGQVFIGITGGGVVGAVVTFIALRPRWRDRRLERLLLHSVGAVVIVAAVVALMRE